MIFIIEYDKQPADFLRKIEKHVAIRIMDKIDTLKEIPVPHGAKSVVGHHGVFRIRIGKYRALYRVDYSNQAIIVIELDKRSKIFD